MTTRKHKLYYETPDAVKQFQRRYTVQSDGDHEYFVEVGMEGEFERWVQSYDGKFEDAEGNAYEGHDYEKNRIDGRFTFADPKCE